MRNTVVYLLCAISIAFLQNCAPKQQNSTGNLSTFEKMKNDIDFLDGEINLLANSTLTCRSNNDCLAIEVGFKGCGGPRKYVVTSVHNDTLRLQELIQDLTLLEQSYGKATDAISTCEYVMPPQIQCQSDACQRVLPSDN